MREALRPFAAVANIISDKSPSSHVLIPNYGITIQHFRDAAAAYRAALSADAGMKEAEPVAWRATIRTCCITGAIVGDGGACGDCDPCIFGGAHVPPQVKRLIVEKNSLIQQIGELSDRLGEIESASDAMQKAVEAETERCAKICDAKAAEYRKLSLDGMCSRADFQAWEDCEELASNIRSRPSSDAEVG